MSYKIYKKNNFKILNNEKYKSDLKLSNISNNHKNDLKVLNDNNDNPKNELKISNNTNNNNLRILDNMIYYLFNNSQLLFTINKYMYICAVVVNNKLCVLKPNDYRREFIDGHLHYSMHAEVNALHTFIKLYSNKINKIKYIYILRMTKSGNIRNCTSCISCCEYIKNKTNLNKIYCFNFDRTVSIQHI
jgi:hypothetical protein